MDHQAGVWWPIYGAIEDAWNDSKTWSVDKSLKQESNLSVNKMGWSEGKSDETE
jgi:hypothetical protein